MEVRGNNSLYEINDFKSWLTKGIALLEVPMDGKNSYNISLYIE